MEYIVVKGKRIVRIPEEELQFLQLKRGTVNRDTRNPELPCNKFFYDWCDMIDKATAKKYSMPIEDVELGWFRRFKNWYDRVKHKDFIAFGERFEKLDQKDPEFAEKHDDIVKELCEKSGIKYFPEYRNPQVIEQIVKGGAK